jgi:hypothetical protein
MKSTSVYKKLTNLFACLVLASSMVAVDVQPVHALAAPSLKWSREIPAQIIESSPMPVQVNSGAQDVVFGARNGKAYVLNGEDGTDSTGWPVQTSNPIDSTASSADTNGDGKPEIFIGSGFADIECSGGALYSFEEWGGIRFAKDLPDNAPYEGAQCSDPAVHSSPAIGDINKDGEPDLTFGVLGLRAWSVSQSGNINFGWPFYWDDTIYASPALADITGDGQSEVIMPGDSSPGGQVDVRGGMVRAMTGKGQTLWQFNTNEIVRSSPSIGDITGDGDPEIVFGTGNYWARQPGGASDCSKVFALRRNGSMLWSKDIGAQTMASPTLADINGDGVLDVAIGGWKRPCTPPADSMVNDGRVWVLDGKTGNPLPGYPIASGGFLVIGQIVTADIDNDGGQDLIVPTANGVHVFSGKTGVELFKLRYGEASYQNAAFVTDLDGNGQLDIIIAGTKGDGSTGIIDRYEFGPTDGAVLGTNSMNMSRNNQRLTGSWTNVPLSDAPTGEIGKGYWMVASDGGVFPFGSAKGYGSTGNIKLTQPMVGMASSPSGQGYWLVAADGGIFPFGDAPGRGSTGNVRLTQPMVGMASSPSGQGYWLVAADGGIFPFGDARGGLGSTGNIKLRSPIVGMKKTASGNGYWLVAADGGIFPFGDAVGYGSAGNLTLTSPVVGMMRSPAGGYVMAAADGGTFTYNATSYGTLGGLPLYRPVVGISAVGAN